jgi:hypothetical protein
MHSESSTPAPPLTDRAQQAPWIDPLAWAILSFVGFVAAIYALVWPAAQLEEIVGLPHAVHLGLLALGWVLASGLLALVAGRFVFGKWPEVRPAAWPVLIGGAVVSAATDGIITDWTIAKFGMNEAELVGPMSLLFGVVAGVAVAGFGVQVAPRRAVWSPLFVVAGGAVLGALIILSNVPGLADGLGTHSGPLAIVTVGAALYIGAVGVLSLARLRSG